MWDGVLHMVPPPGTGHQGFGSDLSFALKLLLRARDPDVFVAHETAVADASSWPHDYRTPDLVVCLGGRGVAERWVTRADLVVEIRSPDDESWDKLPFYADHDVVEMLIVDRAANRIDLLRRRDEAELEAVRAGESGWLRARGIELELRWDEATASLRLRHPGDATTVEMVSYPRIDPQA